MISIKTEKELEIMKKSGSITAQVMENVLKNTKPGISKAVIEKIAVSEIKKLGGQSSFTTVPGYKWATCINLNSEVVHGVPDDHILKENDLVSIDLGVQFGGLHTDMARTVFLGIANPEIKKFLKTGWEALKLAIKAAEPGNHIGSLSAVIQEIIEKEKFSVVRELTGHGIGKSLHEDPEVPGFVTDQLGPELKVGMTLAIEVIYAAGSPDVVVGTDGWTIITKDGSNAGLFEDTVAITESGALVLTQKN